LKLGHFDIEDNLSLLHPHGQLTFFIVPP